MSGRVPLGRRELLRSAAAAAGITALPRPLAAAISGSSDWAAAAMLPADPEEPPLDWCGRADAFDDYIMNPANRVLRKRGDGTFYFASALEGTGDGGLTTFAPILLGKLLRGEAVGWLAPSMAAYYSREHGIFLDGRNARSCEYWYLMNVNALAAGVVRRHFSGDEAWLGRVSSSAERLIALAHQVDYDFADQGYRFGTARPWTQQAMYRQPDAVGGYAYLQLLAFQMFGGSHHLAEAKEALRRYLSFPANPWYEVPSGAMACLAAARLSVTGAAVDAARALRFVLDPGGHPLQTGKWGDSEVGGLMAGFRTEPAGEAYSMESLVTAGYLLPVLRYRPDFANVIGRYVLNVAANMRLFYSDCIAPDHQSRPELTAAVPYERLTRTVDGKSPYASGDFGSHRSIYGGAYALWWGELVKPAGDCRILQLDLALSDFLEERRHPTYAYYNPHGDWRRVIVPLPARSRLYDLAAHRFLGDVGEGAAALQIAPRGSRVVVVVPKAARPTLRNDRLLCGGVTVDYTPVVSRGGSSFSGRGDGKAIDNASE
jgi:hypothetical protein